MTLTLEATHWTFRLRHEQGRSVLLQSDWDFAKAATLIGWIPCPCGATDGTIHCPHRRCHDMVWEAFAYLEAHVGAVTDDPGYF